MAAVRLFIAVVGIIISNKNYGVQNGGACIGGTTE